MTFEKAITIYAAIQAFVAFGYIVSGAIFVFHYEDIYLKWRYRLLFLLFWPGAVGFLLWKLIKSFGTEVIEEW